MNIAEKIEKLRGSITPDLFDPDDFIDWEAVQSAVDRLEPGVESIVRNRSEGSFNKQSIGNAIFEEPNTLEVLMLITSIRAGVRFQDGRSIPDRRKSISSREECQSVASAFCDIGIARLLGNAEHLHQQLLTAIVADQASRRRFPTKLRLDRRLAGIVEQAIKHANESGIRCQLVNSSDFPPAAKRQADFVIAIGGQNAIVISNVFQAQSGGRQQRDLRTTYPSLRRELEKDNLNFVLIADGQGILEASENALTELFKGVPNCMTLLQAESGALANAIIQSKDLAEKRDVDSPALEAIIDSLMRDQFSVSAADLPSSLTKSKLAIAAYAKKHPDLALVLGTGGISLRWQRSEEVSLGVKAQGGRDPSLSLGLFLNLIQAETEEVESDVPTVLVSTKRHSGLPPKFAVFYSTNEFSSTLISKTARASFDLIPEAKISVLIVTEQLTSSEIGSLRRQQLVLAVNVIVISVAELSSMAQARDEPLARFTQIVLEQSDLEKVSPFVLRGVTPAEMFYGREEEEATLLGSLSHNSVAILGGRRIGKTSLILHAQERLREADFDPYFCDCQAVRNWADFGSLVSRVWHATVADSFKPHHLYDLVKGLSTDKSKKLVILMDEVDQLLEWDQSHSDDEAPEAFFRTCRSISQQGLAQFVFSGERIIAKKIWDPHSPHWNFCKPLSLQQLKDQEMRQLITEPLLRLGIYLDDPDSFAEAVWERTSGHPELVQYVGDALIRKLNKQDRSEFVLEATDVVEVTDCFEYAEQYLETYWGQSNSKERIVSLLLSRSSIDLAGITSALNSHGVHFDQSELLDALRMLDLYGVIHQTDNGFSLKAEWFGLSVGFYGGLENLIERYIKELS